MSATNSIKKYLRDLFRYPRYQNLSSSYDEYWDNRDPNAPLNSFQASRVEFIATIVGPGDSVLDVGCGDGRILESLGFRVHGLHIHGIDGSDKALERAMLRGVEVTKSDIRNLRELPRTTTTDWVLLLEVLEHMPNSEDLLRWAIQNSRKGVILSIPNTGFIVHRIRLLFGRFPLQWKTHPSEHIRFWTLRDMRWWTSALGIYAQIHTYEGIPILARLWPSLFAAGMIVVVHAHPQQNA